MEVSLLEVMNLYLNGHLTLRGLEKVVAPRLPELLRNPKSVEGQRTGVFERLLSELHDGLITEPELQSGLRSYLARITP